MFDIFELNNQSFVCDQVVSDCSEVLCSEVMYAHHCAQNVHFRCREMYTSKCTGVCEKEEEMHI